MNNRRSHIPPKRGKIDSLGFRLCKRCGQKAALKDTSGNPSCEEHRRWQELMDWGKAHHWPDLHGGMYALAPGYDMWFVVLCLCTLAMVEELHAVTVGNETAQDEIEEVS